ncbi:MAG TPA: histidine kinase [Beutenbergiaceae bacterium]|nr:histidine kinase [Beutenbergiaceae bacterium]
MPHTAVPARRRPDKFRIIGAYVHCTHIGMFAGSLLAPLLNAADTRSTPVRVLTAGLAVVVVATGALALMGERSGGRVRVWGVGRHLPQNLLSAAGLVAALALLPLAPDTGAFSSAVLPLALALRTVAGGTFWAGLLRLFAAASGGAVLVTGVAILSGLSWQPLTILVATLVALGVLGQDSMYYLAMELDDLRTLEAERAVASERQRFSGDLHDIQGQHLQLIAVEAELVRRLIAGHRHTEAAEHAQRTHQVATQALTEMHRVVHAYRDVQLAEELANAARVLESAGVRVHTEHDEVPELPEEQDRLLGRTVREAVTNMLKHSGAAHCMISLAHAATSHPGVTLTITDSGPAHRSPSPAGTGLQSLQEGYRRLGGELSVTLDEGARLQAWLPVSVGAVV